MRGRDAEFTAWAQVETPGLLRRAYLLSADWQRAEDLVQETLVRLYVHWSRVDRHDNPVAYAHTTLFHVFISGRRRKSASERPTAELPERPSVDPSADLALDLARALDLLSPRERCVVIARYLDDRSVVDVARMVGRTPGWVRTTAHRALERLRQSPALSTGSGPLPAESRRRS
jgi:RNA polymerase sigma-70 factor (sigma-E family)